MDTAHENKNPSNKMEKKNKSRWVYIKIGTRIVDVKKIRPSNDEDMALFIGKQKVLSHTKEKRNREIWKWATGGKSVSNKQVTTMTTETSTKFVYKSEQ